MGKAPETAKKNIKAQTYLCLDPAEQTFAYTSVSLSLTRGNLKSDIHYTGFIRSTIHNLTPAPSKKSKKGPIYPPFTEELTAYSEAIDKLLDTTNPAVIGSERFQARTQSKLSETVNMMNGILLDKAKERGSIYAYPASQWKNWINKVSNLESLYHAGNIRGLQNHTIDSYLMAIYLFRMIHDLPHGLFMENVLINKIRTLRSSWKEVML